MKMCDCFKVRDWHFIEQIVIMVMGRVGELTGLLLVLPWTKKRTIIEIRGEKNAVSRVISCSISRDQRRASPIHDCPRLLPCADRAWSSMISHVEQRSSRRESRGWFFFLSRVVLGQCVCVELPGLSLFQASWCLRALTYHLSLCQPAFISVFFVDGSGCNFSENQWPPKLLQQFLKANGWRERRSEAGKKKSQTPPAAGNWIRDPSKSGWCSYHWPTKTSGISSQLVWQFYPLCFHFTTWASSNAHWLTHFARGTRHSRHCSSRTA